MRDDLYFIPMLRRALEAEDVGGALNEAFGRIETDGRQARFARGYRQFQDFIAEVRLSADSEQDLDDRFVADEITMIDGAVAVAEITLNRDNDTVATIRGSRVPASAMVENIIPGRYHLTLTTGRLLWEGTLENADLIVGAAAPGRPLELAASTQDSPERPTCQMNLLNDELIIRVFAGRRAGRMEIELRAPQERTE